MGNHSSRPFTRPVRVQIGNGFDFVAKNPSHLRQRLESWLSDYKDQTLRVFHENTEDYDRVATDIIPDVLQKKFNGQITLQHLQPRVRDRALEQARLGASELSSLPIAAAESFLLQNKWIRYALNARSVFGRSGVGYFPPGYGAPSEFRMQGPAPIPQPAYPVAPASSRGPRGMGPLAGSAAGAAAAVLVDPVAAVVIGAAAVGVYSYAKYMQGKRMYVLELQPVPNIPLQPSQTVVPSAAPSLPFASATPTTDLGAIAPQTTSAAVGAPFALGAAGAIAQFPPFHAGAGSSGPSPATVISASLPRASTGLPDQPILGPSDQPTAMAATGATGSTQPARANIGIPIYDRVPLGTFIPPSALGTQLPTPHSQSEAAQVPGLVLSPSQQSTATSVIQTPTRVDSLPQPPVAPSGDLIHPNEWSVQPPLALEQPVAPSASVIQAPSSTTTVPQHVNGSFVRVPGGSFSVHYPMGPLPQRTMGSQPANPTQTGMLQSDSVPIHMMIPANVAVPAPTISHQVQPFSVPTASTTLMGQSELSAPSALSAVPVAPQHSMSFPQAPSFPASVGTEPRALSFLGSVSESTTTLPPLPTADSAEEAPTFEPEGMSPKGPYRVDSLSAEGQPPLASKDAAYPHVYPQVAQDLFWPHSHSNRQGATLRREEEGAFPSEGLPGSAVSGRFAPLHLWHPGHCS